MKRKFDTKYENVVRAVGYAIWSWVAIAFALTVFVRQRTTSVLVIGSGANEQLRDAVREEMNVAGGGFLDGFVSVVTFDFGYSMIYGGDVWTAVGSVIRPTVVLVAASLSITAILSAGMYALAQTPRSARPVRVAGRIVGAVPAVAWSLLLFTYIAFELSMNEAVQYGSNAVIAIGAGGIALPLVALVARTAGGHGAETFGEWVSSVAYSDGRVAMSWFVSALVVIESTLNVPGVGYLWMETIASRDVPLFLATTVTLTLPLVLVNAIFVGLPRDSRFAAGTESRVDVETDGSGAASTGASLGDLFSANYGIPAGVIAFVGLLVAGLTVSAPPPVIEPMSSRLIEERIFYVAGSVTLAVISAVGVGGLGGVALAVAAVQSQYDEETLQFVVDFPANVPFAVLAGLAMLGLSVTGVSFNSLAIELATGGIAGVALTPLVFRIARRELTAGTELSTAIVPVAGFLANAGVFVAFALWQVALVSLPGISRFGSIAIIATFLGVSLPALALLVLGDGLRTAAV